jgi:hypothetical protein
MATHYSPKIVAEGLSLYFDPANAKSYPGSGSTIYDLSGNGNHGTIVGGLTFTNGYMAFDGTDDQINVTSNQTSLDFRDNQTIMIWMYHTYTSGRKNPYNQAYGGYGTWTHEQGNNINYYYGDAGTNAQPYTSINSGTTPRSVWNLMTSVRSTAGEAWYRNGSLITSGSNPYAQLTQTTGNITIGNGYAGRWVGNMGPVLLYKKNLSADEITQNYNALRVRFGI